MSQVDNLLNSLSIDEEAVYTAEPAVEKHIVIGNDRFITVPDELKRIAVQYDHDIETVTFDCPRYWDNHDMSAMQIYINYLLPNGDPGSYIAKNIAVDGDLMHFDWTISRDVTPYKGNLSFLVCVKKTDTDGNEENHWNSELCRDLYISEGLECSETILSEYPDIITDLLTRMDTVEAVAVSYEEMEAAASAAEYAKSETLAMSRLVNENTRFIQNQVKTLGDSFANPIKRTARGDVIRVNDVSPIEHTAHVTVAGKNLFDVSKITATAESEYGYISEVGENYIVVTTPETYYGNGNCGLTLKLIDICPGLIAGEKYTLSGTSPSTNRCIYLRDSDRYWNFGTARTLTADDLQSRIAVYGLSAIHENGYGDCKIENLQLELGDTVTDYEPYIDPSTVTLNACSKNIAPITNVSDDCNGLTVTPNADGTITITGAITGDNPTHILYLSLFNADIRLKANHKYALTLLQDGVPYEGTIGTRVTYDSGTIEWNTLGNNSLDRTLNYIYLFHNSLPVGDTTKCGTYKLQLEVGEAATDWEAYKGTTYTPATDGTVDISAVYPTMTLYTNSDVNIDVEYNADSNVVVSEIHNTLNEILSRISDLEALH